MPEKKTRHGHLQVYFRQEEIYKTFKSECIKMGIPMASVVRMLVNDFLKERKEGDK